MPNQTARLEELTPLDVPLLRTEIPGPSSKEQWAREIKHSSPGLSALASLSQLVLSRGFGGLVQDVDGNVLIDFAFAMIGVGTGHRHPKVQNALEDELNNFLHTYDMASPARVQFFELLAELLPEQLQMYQMYSGGTETVEAGMRLAKSYTKQYEFIGLYKSFHGKSAGAMGLMGISYKNGFGPRPPGYALSPNAYCYRCPLGLEYPECGVACADMMQEVYDNETTGEVAAVVVEPIQGAGGIIVPPPEFLPKVEEFCRRNGLLLFVDEIFTGGGRTGKMWSWEHFNIKPDIVALGKGIGSGYPLGVIASSKEIMADFPWAQPAGGSTTFGGNNMAARAGHITLQTILEENLVEQAAEVGDLMLARLREMQDRHRIIGDVRGKGLVIGVEFVRDPITKELISTTHAEYLFKACLRRGLLLATATPNLRIMPSMVIGKQLAIKGLDLLDESISELEETMNLEA